MPISADDTVGIQHINYVSNLIHDYADTLYEGLMEMEYEEVKEEAHQLIQVLADLLQSLSEET
jgi:predicted transcriptional regulator